MNDVGKNKGPKTFDITGLKYGVIFQFVLICFSLWHYFENCILALGWFGASTFSLP